MVGPHGSIKEPEEQRGGDRTWGSAAGQRPGPSRVTQEHGPSGEEQQALHSRPRPWMAQPTLMVRPLSTAGTGSPDARQGNVSFPADPAVQQPPTAAAFVSLVASEGGQRSPTRLRYGYSSIDSPRQRAPAILPDFIQVEEVPAEAAVVSAGPAPTSGSCASTASAAL